MALVRLREPNHRLGFTKYMAVLQDFKRFLRPILTWWCWWWWGSPPPSTHTHRARFNAVWTLSIQKWHPIPQGKDSTPTRLLPTPPSDTAQKPEVVKCAAYGQSSRNHRLPQPLLGFGSFASHRKQGDILPTRSRVYHRRLQLTARWRSCVGRGLGVRGAQSSHLLSQRAILPKSSCGQPPGNPPNPLLLVFYGGFITEA